MTNPQLCIPIQFPEIPSQRRIPEDDPMCQAIKNGKTFEIANLIENGWTLHHPNAPYVLSIMFFYLLDDPIIWILETGDRNSIPNYPNLIFEALTEGYSKVLEWMRDRDWPIPVELNSAILDYFIESKVCCSEYRILLGKTQSHHRWWPIQYDDPKFQSIIDGITQFITQHHDSSTSIHTWVTVKSSIAKLCLLREYAQPGIECSMIAHIFETVPSLHSYPPIGPYHYPELLPPFDINESNL